MQAILSLEIPYQPLLADVRIGSNAAALHAIQQWTASVIAVNTANAASTNSNTCLNEINSAVNSALIETERCMLCWGGSGVGKSALALALENTTGALRLNETSTPRLFESAIYDANIRAIVIDNIEQLDHAQARAAFNLYNYVRANDNVHFWASSRVPPNHMVGLLPDLASRLSWGLVFELLPLTDTDSIAVLQAQSKRLGFELSKEAAQYLLLRLERNLSVLVEQLSNLNNHALKLKKPVNTHLVQQWYANVYLPAIALQQNVEIIVRKDVLNNTVGLPLFS